MKRKAEKDIRVAATTRIWGFATAMLAICIPIVDDTRDRAVLPIAVISGATIATFAVWRRRSENQPRSIPVANVGIKDLEQRISNLEIICSSQELDLQKKIQQLEAQEKQSKLTNEQNAIEIRDIPHHFESENSSNLVKVFAQSDSQS